MISPYINITSLNWNKVDGLLPAIIQDHVTGQVLMLGYMDQEALQKTCESGNVTFYSRTKKRIWTKGETSGHKLMVMNIQPDCDQDTLLIQVKTQGPCCHLNNPSCFVGAHLLYSFDVLIKLRDCIEDRYQKRPSNSYVTKLFEEGIYKIAQKIGEEGVEVALAGVSGIKENIINESADLLFHLLILLKQVHVDFNDVTWELESRYGSSTGTNLPTFVCGHL